jgi:hypothetical protein
MRRPLSFALIGLGGLCGLLGLVVAACTPDTSAPTLAARSGVAGTLLRTPAAEVSLLQPTPALPPFTDFVCLECHTDRDKLAELALPLPVQEALSSGPG